MGESRRILLLFLFPLFLGVLAENAFSQDDVLKRYKYLSPLPFSLSHNPETVIVLRFGEKIDLLSIRNEFLKVTGEKSGLHTGTFTISQDHLTLIFIPDSKFSYDEIVSLHLREGIKVKSGRFLPPFDYWFTISPKPKSELSLGLTDSIIKQDMRSEKPGNKVAVKGTPLSFLDFKFPTIIISNQPTQGNILTTLVKNASSYLYIFDNKATPVYARLMPHPISNLKPHPSGRLTYYDSFLKGYIELDSSLNAIDTIFMKNGYRTDAHEIVILNDGHILLLAYDPKIVDMSKLVVGGNPFATVSGLVIQELDENENLIFEWRSWDYFNITDSYADLLSSVVDYVHGNSLDADSDTSLIISSRNLNEVTKINRLSGEIIWRLGGKNNQFVFENDPRQFAGQHTVVKQKNGKLTMFDNGVNLDPLFSRGIEYEIDEVNKKVKLTHEYRHNPDVYANVSGNLQRLENGNTFVFFGPAIDHSEQFICEFDQNGNSIFEARFDMTIYPTYRAYRASWEPKSFTISVDTLHVESTVQNTSLYRQVKIRNNSTQKIVITSAYNKNLGFYVKDLPVAIEAGGESSFTVVFPSFSIGKISDKIIFCQETDSTIVTRSLFVSVENSIGTGIENNYQPNYKVSPNPGGGQFNIEVTSPGRFTLRLIDMSGKTIWDSAGFGIGYYNIDISNKPDGLYLVYLKEVNTGEIRTIKLIKQK